MISFEEVIDELRAAAEVCGDVMCGTPPLRWGLLLAELDESASQQYIAAMELIYEGYLVHYRQGRVCRTQPGDPQGGLLAGDVLYARGLHMIAAQGDVVAVGLLARLMASCSSLRSCDAPFADDDALWAYTVAGLAALRAGAPTSVVLSLFDDLDAALNDGRQPCVCEMARIAARNLPLRRREALEAEMSAVCNPAHAQAATAAFHDLLVD